MAMDESTPHVGAASRRRRSIRVRTRAITVGVLAIGALIVGPALQPSGVAAAEGAGGALAAAIAQPLRMPLPGPPPDEPTGPPFMRAPYWTPPATPSPVPEPTPTPTPTPQPDPGGIVVLGRSFPSAATTGVPAGTTLTPYTGPCTIQTDGVVIDAQIIDCDMRVLAQDLVITNSIINGRIYSDPDYFNGSFSMTDSEVRMPQSSGTGVGDVNFVLTRVEVTGGSRSVNCARLHGPGLVPARAVHRSPRHRPRVRDPDGRRQR